MRTFIVAGFAVAAVAFACGGSSSSAPVPSGTFHCIDDSSCRDGYNQLRRDLCTKGVDQARITEVLDAYNGNGVLEPASGPYEVRRITNVYDCPGHHS